MFLELLWNVMTVRYKENIIQDRRASLGTGPYEMGFPSRSCAENEAETWRMLMEYRIVTKTGQGGPGISD